MLQDDVIVGLRAAKEQGKTRFPRYQLAQVEVRGEFLYYRSRLLVPDDDELRANIVRLYHDIPAAGHPGRARTYQLVSKDYTWLGMSQFIRWWVRNCEAYRRIKPNRQGH